MLVEYQLFDQRLTQSHRYASLHLADGQRRVDDRAGVHGGDELHHPNLAGLAVHLNIGELGRERRRAHRRDEARRVLDLLLEHVGGVHGDLLQRKPLVGLSGYHLVICQLELCLSDIEQLRGYV